MLISDIIKDAADLIPNSVYNRASDIENNTDVADIKLAGKTFISFNNLPTISTSVSEISNNSIATYPVEIQFLELAEFDDITLDGDDIRERLIPIAKKLFHTVSNDDRASLVEFADGYEMELNGNVKLYDTIMTGLTLSFVVYLDNTNQCQV